MPESESPHNRLWVGIFFMSLAGAAIYFSKDIPQTSAIQRTGIGPRAFPVGLSCFLLLGGLYQCGCWSVEQIRRPRNSESSSRNTSGIEEVTPGRWRHLMVVIINLGLYIILIPVFGFTITTAVFAVWLMHLLGSLWSKAMLASCLLVVAVKFLFLRLFQVQMPADRFGVELLIDSWMNALF